MLIDTSAVVALINNSDACHDAALRFWNTAADFVWCTLTTTGHETYTHLRYKHDLKRALSGFALLRATEISQLPFDRSDEESAIVLLQKYSDQSLSFHDALCAVVMLRYGVMKAFTFDRDFQILGFEAVPGWAR